jgi:hypothetical protein
MVAYMILGLMAVVAFLCLSQAIPELVQAKPSYAAVRPKSAPPEVASSGN